MPRKTLCARAAFTVIVWVMLFVLCEVGFRLYYKIGFRDLFVTYRLNSLGFRDGEMTERKGGTIQRIMILGDSYSFGQGVRYGDIFPVLLETGHDEGIIEVLNFSKQGWNTKAEADFFFEKGREYDFDVLVLCFSYNDIERRPYPVKHPGLLWGLQKMTFLHAVGSRLNVALKPEYRNYSEKIKKMYLDKTSLEWRQMEEAIINLNDYCVDNGKRFVVFYFQPLVNDPRDLLFMCKNEILGFCKKHDIDCTELKLFMDESDLGGYRIHEFDAHPNAPAHRLAADALMEYLISTGAIETARRAGA